MPLTIVQAGVGGTGVSNFPAPGNSGNVLTSNGSSWVSQAASGGGLSGMQVFTTSGTFNVPSGITRVKVTVVGAGGNGGANRDFGCFGVGYGAGGGGGGFAQGVYTVTAGGTVSVTVGTAPGGTSSFGALVSATGGSNGGQAPNYFTGSTGGAGGTTSGATFGSNGFNGQGGGVTFSNGSPAVSTYQAGMPGVAIGRFGQGGGTAASGTAGIVIVEW